MIGPNNQVVQKVIPNISIGALSQSKIFVCMTSMVSYIILPHLILLLNTVYPKKYAHGFCFAVLCCGYTLTDFPISIRLTSLALWQSNDCPSASKATLMNMDKYFMWIHHERLHNHKKAKHNKPVCIFLGIYCICLLRLIRCRAVLWVPQNLWYKSHQIPKLKCFSSGLIVVFAQSIETRC